MPGDLVPDLRDRTALVTGAAGGLGRVLVSELTTAGSRVAALDAEPSGHSLSVRCNVTEPESVAGAVAQAVDALGRLDLVVCSAGVVSEAPIDELSPDEWHRVVDASLTGTFLTLRAAIPHLRAAGGGRVVALSSGWARRPYPNGAHYAAAKAGVEALVRSAAAELGQDGIRVNAVAPGPFRSPMLESLPAFDEAQRASLIPLGRIGEPSDIARVVLFLLSEESRYVTGQVLGVNGGMLMS